MLDTIWCSFPVVIPWDKLKGWGKITFLNPYENYYHIEKGSEQYEAVKNSNIISILRTIAGASEDVDVQSLNLKDAAEAYISSLGLTEAEMDALRSNLSKEW